MRTMAIETLKILNGLTPPVLLDLLVKRDGKYNFDLLVKREGKYNFRYSNILQIPHVRTSMQGKKSFRYAAPVLWNSQPDNFRTTVSLRGYIFQKLELAKT